MWPPPTFSVLLFTFQGCPLYDPSNWITCLSPNLLCVFLPPHLCECCYLYQDYFLPYLCLLRPSLLNSIAPLLLLPESFPDPVTVYNLPLSRTFPYCPHHTLPCIAVICTLNLYSSPLCPEKLEAS